MRVNSEDTIELNFQIWKLNSVFNAVTRVTVHAGFASTLETVAISATDPYAAHEIDVANRLRWTPLTRAGLPISLKLKQKTGLLSTELRFH